MKRRGAWVAGVLMLVVFVVSARGDIFTYDASLNTLPGAQGWVYSPDGGWAEGSCFSVSGGALHQTTMGYGFWAGTSATYRPNVPSFNFGNFFTVAFRARVALTEQASGLPDENPPTALCPWGFGISIGKDNRAVVIGIAPSYIAAGPSDGTYPNTPLYISDNTGYHDYQISANYGTDTWYLYRDGSLIGQGATSFTGTAGSFAGFGDVGGGGNASGDWTFMQIDTVPEPGAAMLLALAMGAALLRRRN